ncbi:MAG TPA: thrombospondin type 3 repeat-containing protein, partial [Polyangia bacterium]|nr:thrombospondin type 3 repeat-containing protein [Polyangia bacterium]
MQVLVGFAASLLVVNTASAQFLGPKESGVNHGFQLERYEPTTAGESTFGVERPWYSSTRWFAADLTFDEGHHLAFVGGNRGDSITAISNQFVGHVDIAGSFLDRVLIGFSLPVTLYETGGLYNGAQPLGVNGPVGVGDPRFNAMFRLFGHADRNAISLHIGADVWIPRVNDANQQGHDGDAGGRVMPQLVLSGRVARSFRWGFNFGYLWRTDAKLTTLATNRANVVGDETRFAGELAYTTKDNRFNIGPEVWLSSHALNDRFFHKNYVSMEIIASAHYLFADMIRLGVGIGGAPLSDIGTPEMRVLLRLAYAPTKPEKAPPPPPPVVHDRDGDGIEDYLDACPDTAGVHTLDPRTNGCPPPPPDRDGDGVLDADDLCPDQPAGKVPDPLRKGCPAKDTDGDGVYDYEDQCPDTPAGDNPDPKRKGCPAVDTDNDGVFDYEDQCVSVPAGVHPDPKRKGCPKPDRDKDTIPDDVDACPDKAGAPSTDPKKNGCPGLLEVRDGLIVILQPVYFATNKAKILAKSNPLLIAVADAFKAQPEIK